MRELFDRIMVDDTDPRDWLIRRNHYPCYGWQEAEENDHVTIISAKVWAAPPPGYMQKLAVSLWELDEESMAVANDWFLDSGREDIASLFRTLREDRYGVHQE